MALSGGRTIAVLVVVLVLIVAVSGAVLWWVLGNRELPFTVPSLLPQAAAPPDVAPPRSGVGFDLRAFQREAYQRLDRSLVQEGRLPVQPPAVTGKANPFL